MVARVAVACFALLAPLPALAQAPAPEAPKPGTVAPAPLDKAALAKRCVEESEARGLHGKTKLRWQVKCRKGKTRFKPV